MRRLALAGAITCVIVTAVLIIQAMIVPRSNVGYIDVGDQESLPMIRLEVDPTVTAVGHGKLVPGANFRYTFRITNIGTEPVRHLAVRSDQISGPRARNGRDTRTVSDPACSGHGQVDCLFDTLAPGATRWVLVEASTALTRRPGDQLVIRTYLGRYISAPDGAATFDILGRWQETSATFAAQCGTARGWLVPVAWTVRQAGRWGAPRFGVCVRL